MTNASDNPHSILKDSDVIAFQTLNSIEITSCCHLSVFLSFSCKKMFTQQFNSDKSDGKQAPVISLLPVTAACSARNSTEHLQMSPQLSQRLQQGK